MLYTFGHSTVLTPIANHVVFGLPCTYNSNQIIGAKILSRGTLLGSLHVSSAP